MINCRRLFGLRLRPRFFGRPRASAPLRRLLRAGLRTQAAVTAGSVHAGGHRQPGLLPAGDASHRAGTSGLALPLRPAARARPELGSDGYMLNARRSSTDIIGDLHARSLRGVVGQPPLRQDAGFPVGLAARRPLLRGQFERTVSGERPPEASGAGGGVRASPARGLRLLGGEVQGRAGPDSSIPELIESNSGTPNNDGSRGSSPLGSAGRHR